LNADLVKAQQHIARLYEETRQRLTESQGLERVAAALLHKVSLEKVLEIICTEAQQLTGATGSAVLLLEEGDWLRVAYSTGTAPAVLLRARVNLSARIPPARGPLLPGLAILAGLGTLHLPLGHPGRRACALLEALFLDAIPASPAVSTGYHTLHHGLSFPTGDRVARRLSQKGKKMGNQITCPHCQKTISNDPLIEAAATGAGQTSQFILCECGEKLSFWAITAQLGEQKTLGWKVQNWVRTLSHRQS